MAMSTASIKSKSEVAIDFLDTIQYRLTEVNEQLDALIALDLIDGSISTCAASSIADLRMYVARMIDKAAKAPNVG